MKQMTEHECKKYVAYRQIRAPPVYPEGGAGGAFSSAVKKPVLIQC
jgi:hypothetical protein